MPNVGKSSLINCLRRHAFGHGRAVRTGAEPGLTRTISAIRVQQRPPMLVLDTPGVLVPATRLEPLAGLKLALTCTNFVISIIGDIIVTVTVTIIIIVTVTIIFALYCQFQFQSVN